MSINRRQLFLDRFIAYNRSRYKDNPDALARLAKVTLDNMTIDGIAVDNTKANEKRRRVANVHSDQLAFEGIDQRWTCTSLIHKKVIPPANFTNSTPFASLAELQKINRQGSYLYIDDDGMTVLGLVLPVDEGTTEATTPKVMAALNTLCNYQLLTSELSIEVSDRDVYPMHYTYMGDTIVGRITVVRQSPDKPSVGNYLLGYYGQVNSDSLISSGVLAEMVGFGGDKLVTGADNVPWLKFSYFGKILYIAKSPVSCNMTWYQLQTAGLVDGSRIVEINGKRYRVRLVHGIANEAGNEWNDLIYRVHYQDPTGTFWEKFSDQDMGMGYDPTTKWYRDGSINFTQDDFTTSSSAVTRGGGPDGASLTVSGSIVKNSSGKAYGWRPVLEYIGTAGISGQTVADISSPLQLDWIPLIGAEFSGVLKPFGFTTKMVPDARIIPKAVNTVTLFSVTLAGSSVAGKTSIPIIDKITNSAIRVPEDVRFGRFVPYPLDIWSLGEIDPPVELVSADLGDIATRQEPEYYPLISKDLGNIAVKQVDPNANSKFDGSFGYDGTLHY